MNALTKRLLIAGIIVILSACTININLPAIEVPTIEPIPTLVMIQPVPTETIMVEPPNCHAVYETQVTFPRGSYGDTVEGSGDHCFILNASAGQQLTVVASANGPTRLELLIRGKRDIPWESSDGSRFVATLPVDEDYALLVDTDDGESSYRLTIEIR